MPLIESVTGVAAATFTTISELSHSTSDGGRDSEAPMSPSGDSGLLFSPIVGPLTNPPSQQYLSSPVSGVIASTQLPMLSLSASASVSSSPTATTCWPAGSSSGVSTGSIARTSAPPVPPLASNVTTVGLFGSPVSSLSPSALVSLLSNTATATGTIISTSSIGTPSPPPQAPPPDSQAHHWREGNLPVNSKCAACRKACWSTECLTGMRCEWCGATVRI
ncbi:unnamed protein product [Protopolystoma xenopodis]|uniref:Phorbol-ester/DAG-type domain-containing protein n=1 Tax=Protopolystoma xenopodis TaxID=117903 RepID=A0A448X2T3_9PLAT|nr:unnamed protein product [Protopolystoma xenopodis]